MFHLEKPERLLWGAVLVLLLVAVAGPFVAEPAHAHDFADQRLWWRIPFTLNVLSNLSFALWGAAGLGCLVWRRRAIGPVGLTARHGLAALFFTGLLATAATSAWYHWQPDDLGLAVDRLGMAVAFAGLLGLAAAERVNARAGLALGAAMLVLGPCAVAVWLSSGNALPWGLLQFGGMGLMVWLACLPPLADETPMASGDAPIRWATVIALYALAKLFEFGDQLVFDWTGHLVSGHSLKHVVASCTAWPVVSALIPTRKTKAESLQITA